MKAMMPTLKEKKRYALIRFYGQQLTYEDMKEAIKVSFRELHGSVGYARARPLFLKAAQSSIIARINHKSVDDLRIAVLNMRKLGNTRLLAKVEFVSGSLRKIREKFLK